MSDQVDMFEKGRARNKDPDTSKEAAESVNATKLELRVLHALSVCPVGATCGEICDLTGLAWNTVSPRLAPLREKGLIKVRLNQEGRQVKRLGRLTKRKQLVWVAE